MFIIYLCRPRVVRMFCFIIIEEQDKKELRWILEKKNIIGSMFLGAFSPRGLSTSLWQYAQCIRS